MSNPKYADYQKFISPPWLQRDPAGKFQAATGTEADTLADHVRQAAVSGFPDTTGATVNTPPDALPFIGADRVLPRRVDAAETDAAYAERLRVAWDTWQFAGSHGGLLMALARAGFPTGTASGANIVQRTKRYTYLTGWPGAPVVNYATHSGFSLGVAPNLWNRFGIVFGADFTIGGISLATGTAVATILGNLVRTWKPAKAYYVGAWVIVSGPIWGWPPTAVWGVGTWGGGSSRFIPAT